MRQRIESGRKYGFGDFIRIPFAVSPFFTLVMIFNQVLSALLPSIQVLVTARFVDTALAIFRGEAWREDILWPLLGLMLIVAYQYLNWQLMSYVELKLGMNLERSYRSEIAEKRAKLEYRHIEDNDTWDLINRVCADPVGKINGGFTNLMSAVGIVLHVGSLLMILMTQVWWAGLAIVVMAVPLFWLALRSGKAIYEENKEAQKFTRRAEYLRSVLQGRDGVEERTLFGYTKEVNKQWFEKFQAAYKIETGVLARYFIRMKGSSLITVLLSILMIGVLLLPLKSQAITVGMFMGLTTSTLDLVQMMSWKLTDTMKEIAHNLEYLKDLSAFAALSETDGALDLPAEMNGFCFESLTFRHVSFRYPGTDNEILKDFNLSLKGGRHYAFVGVNGAGKTTVTKLLTGLYDNYEGEILINGRELRTFTQAERKAFFSVVYQDFARYQITVRENIALGNVQSAKDEAILKAAEVIGLTPVIDALPKKMETPLGKIRTDGVDLSGGEWQRLAIARTLCNPAAVRILDEPTAALDPVAESSLYEMFGKISAGKSTIFITHRLGAARLADEIIVIDKGKVAEQGSHSELLDQNGIYASMYEAQRSWYQ